MAERVVVLDFDLTLFKTYDFAEAIEGYYASQNIDLSKVTYEQGTAPDLLALIEAAAGHPIDADAAAIERFALENFGRSPHDYIQPDVYELLQTLDGEQGTEVTMLTRGGERSQKLKLAFAAKAIGHFNSTIVPVGEAPKGQLIAGWQKDGKYQYEYDGELHSAPSVMLVDDKISDFAGLPADESAVGVWIQRRAVTERDRLLHRSFNRAGMHIFAISSLHHAVQLLKAA